MGSQPGIVGDRVVVSLIHKGNPIMSCIRLGTMLVLGSVLVGCSTFQINSDYDPDADFAGLQSYAWAPAETESAKDPRVQNDLLEGRVHESVDAELSEKGYRLAAEGKKPDFWVTYHAGVESKVDVTTVQQVYPYYRGYSHWGGYSETYVTNYDEGTLILDVIETKTEKLIWRGSAQARVNDSSSPEKRSERIRAAVKAILERFPPEG
jgi:hypothetical protein